jgi:voltage-gated potassium channel
MVRFIVALVILHAIEVAVWAQFYVFEHCFPDAQTAYYFSLSSYTTVGYGDVVLSRQWRLMGSWEAMLGVLMFGRSTAALATLLHHLHDVRIRQFRAPAAQ